MIYLSNIVNFITTNVNIQILLFLFFLMLIIKIIEKLLIISRSNLYKKGKLKFLLETHLFFRIMLICVFLILLSAVEYFKIDKNAYNIIKKFCYSFIIFILYLLAKNLIVIFFRYLSTPVITRKFVIFKNKNIFDLSYKFVHITIIFISVTTILGVWNVQIGPVLTGLGIAGLAVGLAIQDSLSNIFGGISLILDDAYSEDDFVELSNGESGVIYSIGYRSTKIKTFSEEIIIVPNSKLAQMSIKNLSRPGKNYILSLDIAADYGNDIEYIKETILNLIKNIDGILDFPEPSVLFTKMNGNELDFKIIVSIRSPFDRAQKTDKIYTEIYKRFNELGINIPYSSQRICLLSGGKANEK